MLTQSRTVMGKPLECKELLRTEQSYPFGAADRLVEPICLATYGYEETEYQIHGLSNVYNWAEDGVTPVVRTTDVPYTSRILVRKPKCTADFNGIVVVELLNWASRYDRSISGWGQCFSYYLEKGIVWIGVTVRDGALDVLKRFDPTRYAALHFRNPLPAEERGTPVYSYGKHSIDMENENGVIWDMISQLGVLLKSDCSTSPLYGYKIKKVMATGATAGDLSLYVCGIQPAHCLMDGTSIYDGFLIYMTGAPGEINQTTAKFSELEDRCKFYSDVPFIHVMTEGDMAGGRFHPDWAYMQRRPDKNEPNKKLHRYEIAGASVRSGYDKLRSVCQEDVEKAKTRWRETIYYDYEYPVRYILKAATDALIQWMVDDIEPPFAPLLAFDNQPYPHTALRTDAFGNGLGGIRLPYVDAPLYKFRPEGGASRLPDDVIASLYTDKEDYLKKVIYSAIAAVKDRFILPQDCVEIILEAVSENIPDNK